MTGNAAASRAVEAVAGETEAPRPRRREVANAAAAAIGHRFRRWTKAEVAEAFSRAAHVTESALAGATRDALARVHVHHAPVPELVLGEVPRGTHVLVMTHDHAEDIALCDVALRCSHLGSVGLIGSSAKWSRFRVKLAAEGHGPEALERITTPIGLPDVAGKDPATIAVSVAADLVRTFERDRTSTHTEVNR